MDKETKTEKYLINVIGRLRRLPKRFWFILASLFGVADFLTWSFFSDLNRQDRTWFTLGIIIVAFLLTIVFVIRQPTSDEKLERARIITRTARRFYNEKRYADALPLLETALQLDPSSTAAYSYYGRTLARLGRFEDSIEPLSEAIEKTVIDSNRHILRSARALSNIMLGKYGASLKDLDRNLSENSDLKVSRRQKALVWAHLGDFSNAIEDIEETLERNPNYVCGHATKSVILKLASLFAESLNEIDKAEKLDPESADDFFCLSLAYGQHERFEDTYRCLRIAIERDPKYYYRMLHEPLLNKIREHQEFSIFLSEMDEILEKYLTVDSQMND